MPAGPIVLVFAVVFGVVVGAFWLFVQQPEQRSTQALHRRLKGEAEDVDEDAGDALIERQPKHDRRRLEGIAASAGGGVLRYLALQIERANMDMPPERLLLIAAIFGAAEWICRITAAAVGERYVELQRGEDRVGGLDLRVAQTVGAGVAVGAAQRGRIEVAGGDVADDRVGQAVELVAGSKHGPAQRLYRRHRQPCVGAAVCALHDPVGVEHHRGEVERRRARDHAIEAVGPALRFDQRFAPAARPALEVGAADRCGVVGRDDLARRLEDAVAGEIGEVVEGVAVEGERAFERATHVA
jgi:hypothetical protein